MQTEFWISEVSCRGDELAIESCLIGQRGAEQVSSSCRTAASCVQVFCGAPAAPKPADLGHLTHSSKGLLSYTFLGESRAVCDSAFSDADALVACNELYGKPEAHFFTKGQ